MIFIGLIIGLAIGIPLGEHLRTGPRVRTWGEFWGW